MIDNFDLIKELLSFDSEDDFYFVQILQRKKDNPNSYLGSNNSSRLIKGYYINSLIGLEKQRSEMIVLAELFNARVGINLNRRSYYKTAFNTMKIMAEQMHNKAFKKVFRAWNRACGVLYEDVKDCDIISNDGSSDFKKQGGDRIWLLDIDDAKEFGDSFEEILKYYAPENIENKVLARIPSKSGYHVITTPFDTREFIKRFPEVEIHKNNPVNLYIP